jgi:anti-sigma B factor antagonist
MEIHERVVESVTILDLTGRLVLGEGDKPLHQKVSALAHEGRTLLVLNLQGVPHVDSAGLGAIVRGHTTLSRLGGALKLLHANKRTRDLLAITKLLTIFDLFESEPDAVKSFSHAAV